MKAAAKEKKLKAWPVQDAKARLSDVLREAQKRPQLITRHGQEQAFVISPEAYRAHFGTQPGLLELLLGGPKLTDQEWQETFGSLRSDDHGRDVEL